MEETPIDSFDNTVIPDPGTYLIKYKVTDDHGNIVEKTRTVIVRDTTPPTVTLIGAASEFVDEDTSYSDKGVNWSDNDSQVTLDTDDGGFDINTPDVYTFTYTATDRSDNSTSITRTVTVRDKTPPVITLNGSADVTHEAGTTYTDAGATAFDAVDGTVPVTTSGSVNVNSTGSYTITYTATDDAENTSTASRTVQVVDRTPPPAPSGGDQNFFFYVGDPAPSAPSCPEAGSTQQTVGSVNMNTAGTYEITYTCVDAAGNESDPVTYSIVVSDPADPEPIPIEEELLDLGENETATVEEYSAPLSGEFTQTVPSNLEISEDSLDILCSGDTAVFGGYGFYGESASHPKEIPGLLVEQIWSQGTTSSTKWFTTTYAIPKNDGSGTNIVVTNKATTLWTFDKVHNKDALTYQWTSGLGINPSGPLSTFEPMSGGGDKFYGMFGPHEFHNSGTAGEVGWARKLLKENGTALAPAYPISYTVLTEDNISEWENRVQQPNISGKYTFYDSSGELDLRLHRYINDTNNNLIQAGDIITLAWYPLIQSIDVASFCDAEPADDVVPFYTNSTYEGENTDGVVPNRIQTATITATTNATNQFTTLEFSNQVEWQLVPQSCDASKIVYNAAGGATAEIKVHPTDSTKSQWTDTNGLSVTLDGGFFKYNYHVTGSTLLQTSRPAYTWIQDDDKFTTGTTANQVVTYTAIRPYEGVTGSGQSWSNQTTLTTYGYRTPDQLGVTV